MKQPNKRDWDFHGNQFLMCITFLKLLALIVTFPVQPNRLYSFFFADSASGTKFYVKKTCHVITLHV